MKAIKSAIILIVSGTILNVWLLRSGQQTPYRGSDASTLMEELSGDVTRVSDSRLSTYF